MAGSDLSLEAIVSGEEVSGVGAATEPAEDPIVESKTDSVVDSLAPIEGQSADRREHDVEHRTGRREGLGFKILDRYITRKFLGTFLFAIALIVVVVAVFDAVEKVDDFIEMKAPLSKILGQYYLNFIPYFINLFCGLFTFIAVIFFTSKMAYQTEIVAMLSSGMSFRRLMWPYFISSMVITLISLVLNLWLIPVAQGHVVEFERQYLKKNRSLRYEPHIYRQLEPGTFAYIRNFTGGTTATFLSIESYEDNKVVSSLEARNVKFDEESMRWSAPEYVVRTYVGEEEMMEKRQGLDTLLNLSLTELGKLTDIITTMKIEELNEFIEQQKDKGSDMISYFEVERQKRFSYPLATFILTIIGVSLSSRKVRGGTGLHIGLGIGLCFAYIMIARVAEEVAKGSGTLPGLLVWIPDVVFAIVAIVLYRKAPK